ncbi:MAG: response regulator [Bacteroidota bacterium]
MLPLNNVLLIDDDPMSNMINERIIQIAKFSPGVTSCLEGNEALEYLQKLIKTDLTKFPNIILLDIAMPEMDGWEFLEEFKKFPEFILNACKVCMLSSSIDQHDIDKSRSYKMVYDFISKPLTVEKFEMLFSQCAQTAN